MKKQERGFTLVELLAVIVILAIILLIAVPNVMGIIEKAKEDSYYNQLEMIEKMAKTYLMSNNVSYDENSQAVLTLTELIASGVAPEVIIDPRCGKEFDYDNTIITLTNNNGHVTTSIETTSDCGSGSTPSVPSVPDVAMDPVVALSEGLVPIKWDGSNWIVTTTTDDSWYNYDNKQWANAISIANTATGYDTVGKTVVEEDVLGYFVYIPRYKYKLFNVGTDTVIEQLIEVQFESKETAKSNGNTNGTWLTHPAFTFGTTEVDGLWVGKFEITGTISDITVKPGLSSVRNQTVGSFYTNLLTFDTNHNLNTSADSHMMKNTEWGAVAYLKQSIYGLGTTDIAINSYSGYYTGGGTSTTSYISNTNQSTTGNVTGVYDMAGGAWEYVMGVNGTDAGFSGLTLSSIPSKYIDVYTSGTSRSDFTRRILGDATSETRNWYSDLSNFIYSSYPWFLRGGVYASNTSAGVFAFYQMDGNAHFSYSARVVLIP